MAEHWCKEHQTVWFKKGKMKGYAHPIKDESGEDTSEWCNEPKSEEESKPAPQDNRSKEIEFNMWWKIASEMVGNNDLMAYIETNFKSGKAYRKAMALAVITQSLAILPIKVEDK